MKSIGARTLIAVFACMSAVAAFADSAFPVPMVTASLEEVPGSNAREGVLLVTFAIPAGYHQTINPDFFYAKPDMLPGIVWGQAEYPPPTSGTGIDAYVSGTTRIRLPFKAGSAGAAAAPATKVEAGWQLCADSGTCFVPGSLIVPVSFSGGVAADPGVPGIGTAGPGLALYYLLLAFVGGFALNFMPCVFPVLAVKAGSFIGHSGEGALRVARISAFGSAMGLTAAMSLLAAVTVILKETGRTVLGWGFQFQNPVYVLATSGLVFAFALSLFGAVSIPGFRVTLRAGAVAPGKARTGRSEFMSGAFGGVLTVILATPCTAPFLGAALAFAFSAPSWLLFPFFVAVAQGLALPYYVLAARPSLASRFPRPGAWMKTVEEAMGLLLMATVVWLLSVLVRQVPAGSFVAAMAALAFLGSAAWSVGVGQRMVKKTLRIVFFAVGIGAMAVSVVVAAGVRSGAAGEAATAGETLNGPALPGGWERFSEEYAARLSAAGIPYFVDFSAEWCLTCKVNEAGALSDDAVLESFARKGVIRLRGDYTNPDPVIASWLKRHGRAGVPFYALFRDGGPYPVILPEILTPGMVMKALASLPDASGARPVPSMPRR